MTLDQFIAEHGITTRDVFTARCQSLGVEPPDASMIDSLFASKQVSNPSEGIAIISDDVPKEKHKKRKQRDTLDCVEDHADAIAG